MPKRPPSKGFYQRRLPIPDKPLMIDQIGDPLEQCSRAWLAAHTRRPPRTRSPPRSG